MATDTRKVNKDSIIGDVIKMSPGAKAVQSSWRSCGRAAARAPIRAARMHAGTRRPPAGQPDDEVAHGRDDNRIG